MLTAVGNRLCALAPVVLKAGFNCMLFVMRNFHEDNGCYSLLPRPRSEHASGLSQQIKRTAKRTGKFREVLECSSGHSLYPSMAGVIAMLQHPILAEPH